MTLQLNSNTGASHRVDLSKLRVLRELVNDKTDQSLVIGEWKRKEDFKDDNDWILDGRCIHFNRNGQTMYLGYMNDGLRHGWGIEIPIKNAEFRTKYRVTEFKHGKRVIPKDDDGKYDLVESQTRNSALNSFLLNFLKNNQLDQEEKILPFITNRYYLSPEFIKSK